MMSSKTPANFPGGLSMMARDHEVLAGCLRSGVLRGGGGRQMMSGRSETPASWWWELEHRRVGTRARRGASLISAHAFIAVFRSSPSLSAAGQNHKLRTPSQHLLCHRVAGVCMRYRSHPRANISSRSPVCSPSVTWLPMPLSLFAPLTRLAACLMGAVHC
ncbi:hypothetical protein FA95DRAFT_995978 [Auriscalpium vulgare]|uniref:Uncharacterized protein n=1 Tax=Auriscalpium vulgare TaxID=40419 RepID=A0ACB8RZ06_9AGAM|nr:hypothetical protein FA95DRAFT_995978 [Auriscalpium vulgare]